jgi:replicative DNA helicase
MARFRNEGYLVINSAEPSYRRAPHNLEAEQALLGAILVNNEAYHRVSEFLEARHFHDDLHRSIFEMAATLIAGGKLATPITLKPFFQNREPVDANKGVPQYLGILAANATTIINAKDYAGTIRDLAIRRQLILIGEDMANAAYDSPIDFPPKQQIEEAEARLYALAERGKHGGGEVSAERMHADTLEVIRIAFESKTPVGLSYGLNDVNAKAGRMQASDLIIIAGRPSMGKTSLATAIIRLQPEDVPVHFFSAEMNAQQIGMRRLSERTGIPVEKMREGTLTQREFERVVEVSYSLGRQNLHVDPTGGISIAQLSASARRVKRQRGTKLIVVDYLQLMTAKDRRGDNRVQEVTEITTGLKALAKELDVPIIALSQLSRAVENRTDKRPQLADLRESGSIEQDADVVLFVYREEYYLERLKPAEGTIEFKDWLAKMQLVSGKAEVIIGKQRHGPIGSVAVQFEGACTRFSDLAHGHQANGADARWGRPS